MQYRGCALLLALVGSHGGNALEVAVFPVITACGGLPAALAVAAALTLAYTAFVVWAVPETRNRTPDQIYDAICPPRDGDQETGLKSTNDGTNGTHNYNKDDKFISDNIKETGPHLNKDSIERSISPEKEYQNTNNKNIYLIENNLVIDQNAINSHANDELSHGANSGKIKIKSHQCNREPSHSHLCGNNIISIINNHEEIKVNGIKKNKTDVNTNLKSENISDRSFFKETDSINNAMKNELNCEYLPVERTLNNDLVVRGTESEINMLKINLSNKDCMGSNKECTEVVNTKL